MTTRKIILFESRAARARSLERVLESLADVNTRIKASSGDAGKRWWPPGVG